MDVLASRAPAKRMRSIAEKDALFTRVSQSEARKRIQAADLWEDRFWADYVAAENRRIARHTLRGHGSVFTLKIAQ
jgi:hypothetical protein